VSKAIKGLVSKVIKLMELEIKAGKYKGPYEDKVKEVVADAKKIVRPDE